MSIITVFSSTLLSTHGKSYQPQFSPQPVHDKLFFDEGPRVLNVKSKLTASFVGSIDTSASDPYVQGVEITRQDQYDAGIAKIWSGNPGHILKPNSFGMGKGFDRPRFDDSSIRNKALQSGVVTCDQYVTLPISTGDNDQLENFSFNGIIEPLSIRAVAGFFSTYKPIEAHSIKGSFVSGNSSQFNESDVVVTVVTFEPKQHINSYVDKTARLATRTNRSKLTVLLPFSDARLVRNTLPGSHTSDTMLEAMSLMTGSTGNYISYNQRSATSGWYYDNNASGTDSLVFGGMTY